MTHENELQSCQPELQCDSCAGSASRRDGDVLRCECGSLIARFVAGHIELKCRRCKRTITLPFVNSSESRMG
jgi:hypothetical protein